MLMYTYAKDANDYTTSCVYPNAMSVQCSKLSTTD